MMSCSLVLTQPLWLILMTSNNISLENKIKENRATKSNTVNFFSCFKIDLEKRDFLISLKHLILLHDFFKEKKNTQREKERSILSYTPGESWCWTSNEKSGGAGSATSDFSGNGRSETGFSTSNERSGSGGSPTSCFSALGRSETGKTPKDWEKKRRKAKPIRTNETDILIQMWLCLWRDPGFQSNLFSFTIFFSQREQKQQEKKIKKISSKTQRTASCHTPHTTLSLSTLLSCIHCYYYVTLWEK